MATRWIDHILGPDTEAAKPDPTTVPDGALYQNSDTGVLEINRAGTWADYRSAVDAGALSDLSDVDTTGVADGDALTYDAGSGLWIPGAGGSGGTNKDPRWTALSGQTSIDEFNDASIDVAWARVDGTTAPLGNVDWVENGDVISADHKAADTGNGEHGLVRAIGTAPATGDAWVTCLTQFGAPITNYVAGGLVISDGVTHGSGKQVFSEIISSADIRMNGYTVAGSNWNNTSASVSTLTQLPPLGAPLYVRLVYKGSSQWRTDFSMNGIHWRSGLSLVTQSSFTPAYVGMYSRDAGTGLLGTTSWDFLRRVAGVS